MWTPRLLAVLAVLGAALALTATSAHAGTWTLISCTQPSGAPAPTDGWQGGTWAGSPVAGGTVNACASGGSLSAISAAAAAVTSFTGPELVFTAPAGATIAGGTIEGVLSAPQGQAWIATPRPAFDAADAIASCASASGCLTGGVTGTFAITHPGGTQIFAPAICTAPAATGCPAGSAPNAEVDIHAAEIELDVDAIPRATGVGGGLLDPRTGGVADLRFTASDPQRGGGFGPGVYGVAVQVDGHPVSVTAPATGTGECVPLGTDSATGGLEFDDAQPCPTAERITVPVDTTGLADGAHQLLVTVSDAAGDSAQVIDRRITTLNPVQTPAPPAKGLATRLSIGYTFAPRTTTLDSITATRLPARGTVSAACLEAGCPRIAPAQVPTARAGRLWAALRAVTFTAGQRLVLTIAARHGFSEQIELRMRAGRRPSQRLLQTG